MLKKAFGLDFLHLYKPLADNAILLAKYNSPFISELGKNHIVNDAANMMKWLNEREKKEWLKYRDKHA